MQIHGPAHLHGAQPVNSPHGVRASRPAAAPESLAGMDQLEISREADLVSRAREVPGVRADRVAEIRAAIDAGVYETEDKLDIALGRLLDELSG